MQYACSIPRVSLSWCHAAAECPLSLSVHLSRLPDIQRFCTLSPTWRLEVPRKLLAALKALARLVLHLKRWAHMTPNRPGQVLGCACT